MSADARALLHFRAYLRLVDESDAHYFTALRNARVWAERIIGASIGSI